jgi:drug/metabolite transporter (DMT)-like permease
VGYLLISLSILSFGLGNCLWIYPLKKFNFSQVIVFRSLLTTVLFGCLLIMGSLIDFDIEAKGSAQIVEIPKALALCAFSFFGLYFYVQSLKFEKVSLAVPISSISGIFGVLTGIIVLREAVTINFIGVLLLVLIGVIFVNPTPFGSYKLSKGVRYNFLAAFFWGVSFALFAIPIKSLGAISFAFILEITVFTCSLILLRIENLKWSFPIHKIFDKYILVLAILGFCGVLFYNLSLLYIPATEASLLGVLTTMVSIIIASLLYKERLTVKQYLGIALILVALTLLNIN